MKTSQFHIATTRETPADAEIVSHQLMIRSGMIRKLTSGIYTWSPLGLRVLVKVLKDDDRTDTGLYLPEGSKERYNEALYAEVIEVARDKPTTEEPAENHPVNRVKRAPPRAP